MAEPSSMLATLYQGWQDHSSKLIQAITPLSAEQLALRAAPHLRPIGELAEHIIGGRVHWMYGMLGESNDELAKLITGMDADQSALSAAELVSGLNVTRALIDDRLAHWNAADLAQTITVVRRETERSFTRQWVIWHLIEHDLHHGGELSFSLGIHHLAALDF
jgi:uncharacterized damage-inducible protein DinB